MTKRLIPDHPALRRHLLPAMIGSDETIVLAEDNAWFWKSRALRNLIPALDGSRDLDDLFAQLQSEVSPPEIIYALHQLDDLGLLAAGDARGPGSASEEDLPLWHALGVEDPPGREGRALVRIVTAGPRSDAGPFAEALAGFGIAVDAGPEAGLIVAVTDHYFRPELARINESSLASGGAWMICKLVGLSAWIGPVFRPGRTGCLACLQERLRLNRQAEDFVARKTSDPRSFETSVAASPASLALAAAWAAQEVALWFGGRLDRLEGRLLAVTSTAAGLNVEPHALVRRPQCPVCGDPEIARRDRPLVIGRRAVVSSADGGPRTEHPDATLRRLERHISPITGIVTWLIDRAQDPEGLVHCFSAGHNFALGTDNLIGLRESLRSRAGGKGTTTSQARVSAVCEAIERSCGVYRGDEACVRSTYQQLGDRAIHPHRCLLFSDDQYDRREGLNADPSQGFLQRIPRRFPDDLEVNWTALRSLIDGEVRYLPTALCYYAHPDAARHFYCTGDANGCAAGNTLEEAVLQAFLELVERDSTALWWYNRIARPAVDMGSFRLPYIDRILDRYHRHGRELWALDLTSDTRIPAFAAVSRRVGAPTEDLLIGLGAHLDPSLALLRAVTEVNQFLPAVSRADARGNTLYSWPDEVAIRFWKQETLETQTQLCPDRISPPRSLAEFPETTGTDLFDSLQFCLSVARRLGLDVLLLDQSRPDIELSVVRVVVPGLRHFWPRLGPGRLYDVPVKLGWLGAPIPEGGLNPVAIFF